MLLVVNQNGELQQITSGSSRLTWRLEKLRKYQQVNRNGMYSVKTDASRIHSVKLHYGNDSSSEWRTNRY